MAFSSLEFVSILPIIIAVYWLLWPRWAQNVFLLAASALFMALNGRFHLIVFLAVLGGTALLIAVAEHTQAYRQRILGAGVVGLLLVLCYFKYLGWISGLFSSAPVASKQPLGISYYTFILLGFLLDIRNSRARLSPGRLPSMLLFFPFLLSGPIVRLRSWSAQMSHRRKRRVMRHVTIGTHLFMVGLFKKILIADAIAVSTAPVWANPSEYSHAAIAIAVVGFYVQLYADFSGYTDMARGVARMMGFHLPINFKAPYLATSPLEFWGRWHISLTGWIRDYVFTPLSMAAWRRVRSRRIAPLVTFALVVFLMTLVGLWHGASNNFLLFGMVHGVLIGSWYSVIGTGKRLRTPQRLISWALFQSLLIVSLTMLRADTLTAAYQILRDMMQGAGALPLHNTAIGLAVAATIVFGLQRLELTTGTSAPGRQLVKARSRTALFPVFVVAILGVLYMKGLTLEGVWISPADPFFNDGQEKFIYLKF